MKLIIKEQKLDLLKSSLNENEDVNTMTFWHGGNLDSYDDNISQKSGRYEYGPGLYLTTSYDVVKKYIKGGRKLYKVTVSKGIDLDDSYIDNNIVLDFIKKYVIKSKQNEIFERLKSREKNGKLSAFILNNLIINFNAIKPSNTKDLRQFFIDNDIDYNIVKNPFGFGETMMVLFNMDKIKEVKRINSNDKINYDELNPKK